MHCYQRSDFIFMTAVLTRNAQTLGMFVFKLPYNYDIKYRSFVF